MNLRLRTVIIRVAAFLFPFWSLFSAGIDRKPQVSSGASALITIVQAGNGDLFIGGYSKWQSRGKEPTDLVVMRVDPGRPNDN